MHTDRGSQRRHRYPQRVVHRPRQNARVLAHCRPGGGSASWSGYTGAQIVNRLFFTSLALPPFVMHGWESNAQGFFQSNKFWLVVCGKLDNLVIVTPTRSARPHDPGPSALPRTHAFRRNATPAKTWSRSSTISNLSCCVCARFFSCVYNVHLTLWI